ncbi:exosortase [Thalassotalea psychrophila]|uniref:Exosortase n=1 Tax=Thalassotalea psychrophila TaxID=3065647 RepID=A0ABY9TVE0_9GAMM|nr:exosortase [Colwelliaceae bacterium SQ149]
MINSETNSKAETHRDNKFNLMIFSVFLLWFITFFSGLKAAASVWWVSEIFHHCAFVLPISTWLIYQKRHEILAEAPRPNYGALPFIILLMLIHIFGVAGDIQVFQYIGTFGILPFIAWLFIGTKACSKIIFPLFFIGFAIPVGDELIPVLQEVTADLSVFLLKFIGTPVLRENLYIEIPNGRFFIAEACSGISFLIVSFVFGNLYAYLSFQKYNKKILFLVLSFSVPIIANALRVFGIVLIGHYFGMEYATGTDHLVYGWVFYCFVLFLLIIIGEKLKDTKNNEVISSLQPIQLLVNLRLITIICFLFASATMWQLLIYQSKHYIYQSQKQPDVLRFFIAKSDNSWLPKFIGFSQEFRGRLNLESGDFIDVYWASYQQGADYELISNLNYLYRKKYWRPTESQVVVGNVLENNVLFNEITLTGAHRQRKIFYVYLLNGEVITNKFNAKLSHTLNKALFKQSSISIVAFSFPIKNLESEAEAQFKLWFSQVTLQPKVVYSNAKI